MCALSIWSWMPLGWAGLIMSVVSMAAVFLFFIWCLFLSATCCVLWWSLFSLTCGAESSSTNSATIPLFKNLCMVAQGNAHTVPASLLLMLNNSCSLLIWVRSFWKLVWRGMKPKLGGFLCPSVPFVLENPLCWFSSGLSGGGGGSLSVSQNATWAGFIVPEKMRSLSVPCCRKSDAAEVKQSCSAAADCVQTDFVHLVARSN